MGKSIMDELLLCKGDARCVLIKLNKLGIKNTDFTLEEIGRVLNITRERVRQIESSALKKIKHPKIARTLLEYIRL